MIETEVTQTSNQAGGDIIGRDKITNSTLVFSDTYKKLSAIQALYLKFEKERDSNPQLREFIEELNYYYQTLNDDVIGLDGKLMGGDYESLLAYALRAKERYHMKLYKHQFSEMAQRIHIYLLALVESCFQTHIYPRIFAGATPEEVCHLLQKCVVDRILSELEDNPLDFTAEDVNGMLYFLTGNCHLNWAK